MAEKFLSILKKKTQPDFQFSQHNFKDLMERTTENMQENLWKHLIPYDIDLSVFQGEDTVMDVPLEEIKNKKLVYGLMFHFLGRSLFCSKKVMERFKMLLNKRLMDAYKELEKSDNKLFEKYFSKSLMKIEDIISPPSKSSNELLNWYNEKLTYSEYVEELAVKEMLMSKLREKCNFIDIKDSADLMTDFMALLHLDNYCYRSLKNCKGIKQWHYLSERRVTWMFPLNLPINVEQRRESFGNREDYVLSKDDLGKTYRIEYRNIDRDLDPYMHGGHLRAELTNEPAELNYYLKRHPGRQKIVEAFFQMWGVEVQKNPAALIENMMVFDLIDGDRVCQREIYFSRWHHPPERGNGGIAPYTVDNATTGSRYLNIYFSYILNHWYSYDLNDETEETIFPNMMNPNSEYNLRRNYRIMFEEMMQREYELVHKWIEYKKNRDRKARYLKTFQQLYNYVVMRTTDFFEMYKVNLK